MRVAHFTLAQFMNMVSAETKQMSLIMNWCYGAFTFYLRNRAYKTLFKILAYLQDRLYTLHGMQHGHIFSL